MGTQCSGTVKRHKRRCKNKAKTGSAFCIHHGGKTTPTLLEVAASIADKIVKKVIGTVKPNEFKGQSQKHGFTFENEIRTKVFGLHEQSNNTDIHDIPSGMNRFLKENCSIKSTGSDNIYCGDILRFYNYDFTEKNTIIIIKYQQIESRKTITRIYEVDYNKECHKLLFGDLTENQIKRYVEGVKSIPRKIKGKEAKEIYNYIDEKRKLNNECNFKIQINPKVDGTQSRVQCTITRFEETLSDFITYRSTPENPNIIREKELSPYINSTKRKRK